MVDRPCHVCRSVRSVLYLVSICPYPSCKAGAFCDVPAACALCSISHVLRCDGSLAPDCACLRRAGAALVPTMAYEDGRKTKDAFH